jgi:hypothetical protein
MKHSSDLLTLCIEDLIVRAAQRYVLRRNELHAVAGQRRAEHMRLVAEHRRNVERLVMLRAALLGDQAMNEVPPRAATVH